jgi:hypothetical protein
VHLLNRPLLARGWIAADFGRCEIVEHQIVSGMNRDQLTL